MSTTKNLIHKIDNAKELDFSDLFNRSIDLFKKVWVQGLLLQLFSKAAMLPIIIVVYIPFIGALIAEQQSGYTDSEALEHFFAGMSILFIIFVVFAGLFLGTISAALYAAYFRIIKKIDHNEPHQVSDFFYFIKGEYLGKIFVLMLLAILIMIPAALLCYLPLIYVLVPLSFLAPFFAFNEELSIGDLFKASFSLGNKKWLISFGLLIVIYFCVIALTLLTCGLGSIFLKSIIYHPAYIIYKDVVGFNADNAMDEIGTVTE